MQHQHVGTDDRSDLVRAHTASAVNDRIDEQTRQDLRHVDVDPGFADRRLAELDREWDIDRAIMLWFGGMGTVAFVLAARSKKWWRFPLAAQIGFLIGQTLVGWCPPAAILRQLGFRTRQEIDAERCAILSRPFDDLFEPTDTMMPGL